MENNLRSVQFVCRLFDILQSLYDQILRIWKTKCNIYKTLMGPVLICGCEASMLSLPNMSFKAFLKKEY